MVKRKNKKWIDVSLTLKSGMVHWPGDPSVEIKSIKSIKKGNSCNVVKLSLGSHTGTHMDSPFHYLKKGKTLDKIPFNAIIGKARVIHIKDKESIKVEELKKYSIKKGERILFKTINSSKHIQSEKFVKNFVYISKEAAKYISEKGIILVGIDYLSVGGFYKDGPETHNYLLSKGVWIIEGLDLSKVKEGNYELICLPTKILNSDGAPARATLREI